jgi:hypothetical protein
MSLKLYTNGFFGSFLESPIQIGTLSVKNSVTNFSRVGTFKRRNVLPKCLLGLTVDTYI